MTAKVTDIPLQLHWEDSDLVVMSRVYGSDATAVLQATFDSISLKVFNRLTQAQVGNTTPLTVADVIFNTLQTDARWTLDSTGYNFRTTVAGTFFSAGGTTYRVEVIGTPTSGQPFPLAIVEVDTQDIFGS